MITVHYVPNFFVPDTVVTETCESLFESLCKRWDKFPSMTRIYNRTISRSTDVTPRDQKSLEELSTMRGPFYVVTVPDTGFEIFVYASLFVVAYALVRMANLPTINQRGLDQQSPNNELASRENQIRLNGRIPDMFGRNIATPDLIAVPYFTYEDHVKIEHAEMCLGRGQYEFEIVQGYPEIRDGDTLIHEIPNAKIEVYGPNKSAYADVADFNINGEITEPIRTVKRVVAVNGQTLEPPNADEVVYDYEIGLVSGRKIVADPGSAIDFTADVAAASYVHITITPLSVGYPGGDYDYARDATLSNTGRYIAGGYVEIDTDPIEYYQYDTVAYINIEDTVGPGSLLDIEFTILISAVPTLIKSRFVVETVTTVSGKKRILLHNPSFRVPALAGYAGTSETVSMSIIQRYGQVNLSGTYLVDSVSAKEIVLDSAAALATNSAWYFGYSLPANWADLVGTGPDYTVWYYSLKNVLFNPSGLDAQWVGPFTVNLPAMIGIVSNFIAPQGLYKDDGSNQTSIDVDVEVEITPVNSSGIATGAATILTTTVVGSDESRAERAATIISDALTASDYYAVRARRTTNRHTITSGVVVDEVKWADLYGTKLFAGPHFGNVTTIRALTTATSGALSVKNRKLNARCTRMVKVILPAFSLSSNLQATRRVSDILAHICMDPYIGNRPVGEVDLQNLRETYDDIVANFGSELAGEFCHTFDQFGMSFEETAAAVGAACYSTVYREGSLIKLFFEQAQTISKVLFNHRNKLPNSEVRTYEFGVDGDYDGLDFEYTQPTDGVRILYRIPTDLSATKPRKIRSAGVANPLQAYFHAWREWQRMQYRRIITEFTATQEGELLIPNSKILVADNTRQGVQDGEIRAKALLVVETSQPVQFDIGETYTIFLQFADGTVEAMPVTEGVDEYHVILDSEPSVSLSLDPDNYALTTYLIVRDDDVTVREFLVSEREIAGHFQSKVTAVNYDTRYYDKDADFINAVIDEDANEL